MRFAIDIPNFGVASDPHVIAELAYEAEEAGWDAFFLWDHINYNMRGSQETPVMVDPWITLTAIALRTRRIQFGTMVTPLPRRRPWKIARETVTLDHLSHGRLILGVGLGSDRSHEFSGFGETVDAREHGEMLDEGLEILAKLWSGEEVSYEGKHYQLSDVRFLPRPYQQPHIPIWVAGFWPNKKPFRRAAQWDGVFPLIREHEITPQNLREIVNYMQPYRTHERPFAIVSSGRTSGTDKAADAATITAFIDAGATWWEETFTWQDTLEEVRRRIRLGPPLTGTNHPQ
jgi:alkanesulfonate monooxygenase SsuD/methylene tetrahydromethanopterin reductase-like flavin-dependent oxidoreductase (luciferase family)